MGNVSPAVTLGRMSENEIHFRYFRPWMEKLAPDAAILDVGCGQGHQLYALHRLGFQKLVGIDLVGASIEDARQVLEGRADILQLDAFDFLPAQHQRFDAVILNDVLEHVPRDKVVMLLRLVHQSLRPGGIIHIRVPNCASLLASYSMNLDFTHVTGFTEYSLFQVLDQSGFVDHGVFRPKRRPNWFLWRPWRPLGGMGFLVSAANDVLHRFLFWLRQQVPRPSVFDYNLEVWSRRD